MGARRNRGQITAKISRNHLLSFTVKKKNKIFITKAFVLILARFPDILLNCASVCISFQMNLLIQVLSI